jgi:pilus assembly protein TadC
MNLEESRKQVEMINAYARQMADENKQRNTILHELLEKGYEKKEAVTILNFIQTEADKLIAKKKEPRAQLIGGINGFFIGGAMLAFGGFYWWRSIQVVIGTGPIIFFGIMAVGAGLFFYSVFILVRLLYRKWNGKKQSSESEALDQFKER